MAAGAVAAQLVIFWLISSVVIKNGELTGVAIAIRGASFKSRKLPEMDGSWRSFPGFTGLEPPVLPENVEEEKEKEKEKEEKKEKEKEEKKENEDENKKENEDENKMENEDEDEDEDDGKKQQPCKVT